MTSFRINTSMAKTMHTSLCEYFDDLEDSIQISDTMTSVPHSDLLFIHGLTSDEMWSELSKVLNKNQAVARIPGKFQTLSCTTEYKLRSRHSLGCIEVCRKAYVARLLLAMGRIFPTEYDFLPRVLVLPEQSEYAQEFFESSKEQWFIAKPSCGCGGDGIKLLEKFDEIQDVEQSQVIEEYIKNPCLLKDGRKFDFRVYCVIWMKPFQVFIAKQGMARFCTEIYQQPTVDNCTNHLIHLTNWSINQHAPGYSEDSNFCLLSGVLDEISSEHGVSPEETWHQIKKLVSKTALAMRADLELNCERLFDDADQPNCFQILILDILPVQTPDFKLYLLEVNSTPRMTFHNHGHPLRSMVHRPFLQSCVFRSFGLTESFLTDLSDANYCPKKILDFSADITSVYKRICETSVVDKDCLMRIIGLVSNEVENVEFEDYTHTFELSTCDYEETGKQQRLDTGFVAVLEVLLWIAEKEQNSKFANIDELLRLLTRAS